MYESDSNKMKMITEGHAGKKYHWLSIIRSYDLDDIVWQYICIICILHDVDNTHIIININAIANINTTYYILKEGRSASRHTRKRALKHHHHLSNNLHNSTTTHIRMANMHIHIPMHHNINSQFNLVST